MKPPYQPYDQLGFWPWRRECPCVAVHHISDFIGRRIDRMRPTFFYDERSATADFLDLMITMCPASSRAWQRGINEAVTGADFEWWIRSRGRWLAIRVQAKIHQWPQLDDYGHLDHPKHSGAQVANLLAQTPKNWLPIYIMFEGHSQARLHANPCQCQDQTFTWGCSVAGAGNIQQLVTAKTISGAETRPYLRPLSCFVCCGDDSQTVSILAFAKAYLLEGLDHEPEMMADAPAYVLQLAASSPNEPIAELDISQEIMGVLVTLEDDE